MSLTEADKTYLRELVRREMNAAMSRAVGHIAGIMPRSLIYTATMATLGFISAVAIMDVKDKDIPHISYPLATFESSMVEYAGRFSVWTGGFLADYNRMWPGMSVGQQIIGLTNPQASEFLEVMRQRESSGRYYIINDYGYLGAFSMGAAALADIGWLDRGSYDRAPPAVKNGSSKQIHLEFLQNPSNWKRHSYTEFMNSEALQNQAFTELTNLNIQRGFKIGVLQRGDHKRLTGFAAAAHLGGFSAAELWYGSHMDTEDRNNVAVSEYAQLGENAITGAPPVDFGVKPDGLPMDTRYYTRVSSGFGFRTIRGIPNRHSGIDFPVPVGTPVKATADGKVIYAGNYGGACGYGVKIQHSADYATIFCHLSRIDASTGEWLRKGVQIGLSGGAPGATGSGRSTGPHIHYAVKLNEKFVDPMFYIPTIAGGNKTNKFAIRPQQQMPPAAPATTTGNSRTYCYPDYDCSANRAGAYTREAKS